MHSSDPETYDEKEPDAFYRLACEHGYTTQD